MLVCHCRSQRISHLHTHQRLEQVEEGAESRHCVCIEDSAGHHLTVNITGHKYYNEALPETHQFVLTLCAGYR